MAEPEGDFYYWESESSPGAGPYGSREEAEAAACSDLPPGTKFTTGILAEPLDHLDVDPTDVLETVSVRMWDLAGDAAGNWPRLVYAVEARDPALVKFGEDLEKLVRNYLSEHDPPDFRVAVDLVSGEVPRG